MMRAVGAAALHSACVRSSLSETVGNGKGGRERRVGGGTGAVVVLLSVLLSAVMAAAVSDVGGVFGGADGVFGGADGGCWRCLRRC
jgi:hypothetical protein